MGALPGCAAASGAGHTSVATTAATPQGAPRAPLPWEDFTPATFAKAKAARKFVVMDGSAEWCHWCHVMEATTYHDPAVREILAKSFIAVKVDVDSRPDIEERYGAWGWPATVIFSPDAVELGKYKGYLAPEDFVDILRDVVSGSSPAAEGATPSDDAAAGKGEWGAGKGALAEETLDYIEQSVMTDLDELYDPKLGGWGFQQKAPIAWDNAWALSRAAAGDATRRDQALFTLDAQKAILDPVWGGIYQYSTNGDWAHPHFEKLMPFEAGALDNYAAAYLVTKDPARLGTAQSIRGYIDTFLRGPDGGFYVTQDADLNAHDASKPFVSGHDYYAKGDAERRALGIPRVDAHEYARDNGLAIAAYATLYEATCAAGACDAAVRKTAETAAARVLSTHKSASGDGLTHDQGQPDAAPHLGDNAMMAWGLLRLSEATGDARWAASAQAIGDFVVHKLADTERGGFYESTPDPAAVGVFAKRRVPFEENVMAIRALAKLARAVPGGRDLYGKAIDHALVRVCDPRAIKARGRMIGDFVLALEETKGVRGAAHAP